MRLIGIDAAIEGMTLMHALKDNRGRTIITAGGKITNKQIQRLKELKINVIYITDEDFKDIEFENIITDSLRNIAKNILNELINSIKNKKNIYFDEYKIRGLVKELVLCIIESRGSLINFSNNRNEENYLVEHLINTTIISILIGKQLNYNFGFLLDLAIGAILHDIGKVIDEIEHCQEGYKIIKSFTGLGAKPAIIALQHHTDDNIYDFTKVIKLASDYDNMLYKDGYIIDKTYQCYENIIAKSGAEYSRDIINAFNKCIEVFPNGITVLLNDGQKAIVVRQNKNFPTRPVIRTLNHKQYDLVDHLNLCIDKILQG